MSKCKIKKTGELIYVIAGQETSLVDAECDKLLGGLLGRREQRGFSKPRAARFRHPTSWTNCERHPS
jgi:hypothetical protein